MREKMIHLYRQVYRPLGRHFRTKRMRKFCEILGITSEMEILDVGGMPDIWALSPVHPQVTYLNLCPPREKIGDFDWVVGDGRHLPFKNKSFDVVFSNSVIEHLGSQENQRQLAHEIARVGRSYYVQTPYKWFIIEPHLMTPLVHFLPGKWERRLLRNFTIRGIFARPSPEWWAEWFDGIRLLNKREFRQMFSNMNARIETEQVLGLTKSLLAISSQLPSNEGHNRESSRQAADASSRSSVA